MEIRDVRYRPDWPSRVLAIFALILAALSIGYVVMQGQMAVTQDALVKQFDQRLSEQIQVRQPQLETLVSELRQSAADIKQAAVAQNSQVEQFLTQGAERLLGIEKAAEETVRTKTDEFSKVADLQDDRLRRLEDGVSRLTVARPPIQSATDTELKSTDNDAEVQIINNGQEPLIIDAVRFLPNDVVEVASLKLVPVSAITSNANDSSLELVFSPTENSSATSGDHGIYLHKLLAPLTIQPGATAAVRLAIDDVRHAGWALVGDLTLLHEQEEVQRTRSIAAPFVRR